MRRRGHPSGQGGEGGRRAHLPALRVRILERTADAMATQLGPCDLCAEYPAVVLLNWAATGDVQAVCPTCFIGLGETLRADLIAAIDAQSQADVDPPATVPQPLDPVTGDESDEDSDLDAARNALVAEQVGAPPDESGAHGQPDATDTPPGAPPADAVQVGSG